MNRKLLLSVCLVANSVIAGEPGNEGTQKLVCVGRIEAVDGEVEVSSQMSGTIAAVHVREGDWVTNGTVLAEIDAPREKAALDLATAKLARVKAGNGNEEIAAAGASRDALAAKQIFVEADYQRAMQLSKEHVVSDDELERKRQESDMVRKQVISAERQLAAMKRGPLPEDISLAEAEVVAARANYDLRLIRAVSDGFILDLHRHAGDFVAVSFPTPLLRMANTRKLRVRIEINEQEVYRVTNEIEGEFVTFGAKQTSGQLVVKQILPSFSSRRLFEPDSTARMDTRTLQVLCDVVGDAKVYAGQRVTATFKTVTR